VPGRSTRRRGKRLLKQSRLDLLRESDEASCKQTLPIHDLAAYDTDKIRYFSLYVQAISSILRFSYVGLSSHVAWVNSAEDLSYYLVSIRNQLCTL